MDNLQTIQTISLDLYNNNIKTVNVKQLDSNTRYLKISCTEQGKTIKLDYKSMVAFVRYKKPDGYYVLNYCEILDDGTILFEFTQQMTVTEGKAIADILILDKSKVLLVKNDESGLIELTTVLDSVDDNNGNVTLFLNESNNGNRVVDVNNVEDIYNTNLPVLSTMSFYVNILPTAINHSTVASSHEYDALIDGLSKHVAIEKHMEELDETLNKNEAIRQTSEAQRKDAEIDRETAENNRVEAEKLREENVQKTIDKCMDETYENIQRYSSQMDELVKTANATIEDADDATTRANTSANNAYNATATAQQVTNDAQLKIGQMQGLIDLLNESVSGVINDTTSSNVTTYSSVKIETLIQELRNTIDTLPKVHYDVGEPNSSIGKDGDIYMMIIEEEATETVGE